MFWAFPEMYRLLKSNGKTDVVFKKSDDEIVDFILNLPETCTLDVAERGPLTLDEISEVLGVTKERIRQIIKYDRKLASDYYKHGALTKIAFRGKKFQIESL
jgi:hypothetical protein